MSKQNNSATPRTRQKASAVGSSATASSSDTRAGEAIAPEQAASTATKQLSKIQQVMALLSGTEGATLSELVEATGWQKHTVRAALTGLKKKGHVIERGKRDEITCYTIKAGA